MDEKSLELYQEENRLNLIKLNDNVEKLISLFEGKVSIRQDITAKVENQVDSGETIIIKKPIYLFGD